MKDQDIKLYALPHASTVKIKAFLDKCGVDYDCVEVDKLDGDQRRLILEEIKKTNPACAFPMILIGAKVIIGFKREEIKEALNLE